MTQVEIAFECDDCNESFDEYDDGETCSVCQLMICEECQQEHGKKHCFETNDAVKKVEKPKNKRRKKK